MVRSRGVGRCASGACDGKTDPTIRRPENQRFFHGIGRKGAGKLCFRRMAGPILSSPFTPAVGGACGQSPEPGSGEKYFSYLPGTPSNSLASEGGSFFWVMFGQDLANSALSL